VERSTAVLLRRFGSGALGALEDGPSFLEPTGLAAATGWTVGSQLPVQTQKGIVYFSIVGVICALLITSSDQHLLLWLHACFFGLTWGARAPMITAKTADLFPGTQLGAILGVVTPVAIKRPQAAPHTILFVAYALQQVEWIPVVI